MPRPDDEHQPSSTRRPHNKSRGGCADCRHRRVKCGEEKPKCKQCVRREVPCIYRPAKSNDGPPPIFAAINSPPGNASITVPSAASPESSTHVQFTARDLALLHRWTIVTSRTIVNDQPDPLHSWQIVFPEVGFQHPFVLYGIFSLAALQHAHTSPTSREALVAEASSYHNLLIQGFRDAVSADMEGSCEALFVCASLNIIYVFGMYGWIHEAEDSESARRARVLGVEWVPLARGVALLLRPYDQRLRDGPLAPILDIAPFFAIDPDHELYAEDADLRKLSSTWADGGSTDIYEACLLLLRRSFAHMSRLESTNGSDRSGYHSQTLSAPMIWICLAPEDYFTLLAQRQPPALILFAYVAVLFHRLDDYWFFKGWGRSIVKAVDELLGEYWRPWTQWPKERTNANDSNTW